MKDIHRDIKIDRLIGKQVRIVWFDGEVSTGIVSGYDHGHYQFITFSGNRYRFRKSHIKRVSRL